MQPGFGGIEATSDVEGSPEAAEVTVWMGRQAAAGGFVDVVRGGVETGKAVEEASVAKGRPREDVAP